MTMDSMPQATEYASGNLSTMSTFSQLASVSSREDEQENVCSTREMLCDSNTSNVHLGMSSSMSESNFSMPLHESSFDKIKIETWHYPPEFREKHFDVLLIYTVKDKLLAEGFRYVLEHCITLENGEKPNVYMLDSEHLSHKSSKFTSMGEAIERSTYMFMMITETFCSDSWAEIQRDECLMEAINNPLKRWCVIPIIAHARGSSSQLPFGLRALKGVIVTRIFKNRDLSLEMFGDSDPPQLNTSDVDHHFLRNMTSMLNMRINMKLQREAKQEKELQEWIKQEKEKRWKDQLLAECKRQEEERQRLLRLQNFKEEILHGRPSQLPSDNSLLSEVDNCVTCDDPHSTSAYEGTSSRSIIQQQPQVHHHYHVTFHGKVERAQFGDANQMNEGPQLMRTESESSMISTEYEVVVDRPAETSGRPDSLDLVGFQGTTASSADQISAHAGRVPDFLSLQETVGVEGFRVEGAVSHGSRRIAVSPSITTDAESMLRPCSRSADEQSPSPEQSFTTLPGTSERYLKQPLTASRSHGGLQEGSRTAQILSSLPIAVVQPTVTSCFSEPGNHEQTKPMVVADSHEHEQTSPKSIIDNSAVEVAETSVKRLMMDEGHSLGDIEARNAEQSSVSAQSVQQDVSQRTEDDTGDTCVKQLSDASNLCVSDSLVIQEQYFSHPVPPSNDSERESGPFTLQSVDCAASVNPGRTERDENREDRRLASLTNRASRGVSLDANRATYKAVPSSVDQSSQVVDSRTSAGLPHSQSETTFEPKGRRSKDDNSAGGSSCIVS